MKDTKRELKDDFKASLQGFSVLEGVAEVIETTEPEVSVRTNPAKEGEALFADAPRVGWWGNGHYLADRPAFTRDPALHQGRYYVQDASSMFQAAVIAELCKDSTEPLTLLDACAAPGGKTTGAIDALPAGSLVVANEISPTRAAILKENVIKWGCPTVIVTRSDTRAFRRLASTFDIITVDAPCSGEGMMRKDDKAVAQWSPGLVEECAARQREIIDNLWGALKPGGYLIYSTCTFNRHENEEIVDYIINEYGAESVPVPQGALPGITPGIATTHHCYRFLPGRVKGEGLFLSVLRKPGEPEGVAIVPGKNQRKGTKPVELPADLKNRITRADDYTVAINGDLVTAFPKRHAPLLAAVEKAATVIHAGVAVAERAGKDFAPTQSLAMSTALAADAFPRVEVDTDTALSYLRRQAVTLADTAPRGYVLLTYGSYPLGFVKNLGNRANNLYPREWRILSTY